MEGYYGTAASHVGDTGHSAEYIGYSIMYHEVALLDGGREGKTGMHRDDDISKVYNTSIM